MMETRSTYIHTYIREKLNCSFFKRILGLALFQYSFACYQEFNIAGMLVISCVKFISCYKKKEKQKQDDR